MSAIVFCLLYEYIALVPGTPVHTGIGTTTWYWYTANHCGTPGYIWGAGVGAGAGTYLHVRVRTQIYLHVRTSNSLVPSSTIQEIVETQTPLEGEPSTCKTVQMPTFSPEGLIGCTYLTDPDEDGQCFRAKIVHKIKEHEDKTNQHPDKIKFLVSVDENKADEIVSYNDILHFVNKKIERDDGQEYWRFKQLVGHQGPLQPDDPRYKGSSYNVLVEWEDGSTTYEPLTTIAADDPVTVALYAKEKGLLDTPGWKRLKRITNREKKLIRMIKQVCLKSLRHAIHYKCGYQIPRTVKEAFELDKKNGNISWEDAITLELLQIHEYNASLDMGMGDCKPAGYKKIQVHFVFDVKHDGWHKDHLVADGHLTDIPIESAYSGVVSLQGCIWFSFLLNSTLAMLT